MKFKYILIILAVSVLFAPGCKDYLGIVPEDDIITIPQIFETREGAARWKRDTYEMVDYLVGNEIHNPAILGADEFSAGQHARVQSGRALFYLGDGLQSALNPLNNMWAYNQLYYYLRHCNTFIEYVDDVYNLLPADESDPRGLTEKDIWTAEIKAVKAFYYFELIKRYGPIVLVPDNIDVWAPLEDMRRPRSPFDVCIEETVKLLDEAIPYLQTMAEKSPDDYMFFSQEAAMGLRAKILVYAASPLYNGNVDYRDMKNYEGTPLFSAQYDREKWRRAAEAVDDAIEKLEALGYGLIQGMDEYPTDLLNHMRDVELSVWAPGWNSKEAVFMVNRTSDIDLYILPQLGIDAVDDLHYDGTHRGNIFTNIKMVETYYTRNGLPLMYDQTWDDSRKYTIGRESNASVYMNVVPINTDVLRLHLDREPRFYANIAAPNTYWQRGPLQSAGSLTDNNLLVQQYRGQRFGLKETRIDPNVPQNLSGYWIKKRLRSEVHTRNYFNNLQELGTRTYVGLRMADLYLLSAEAWNEYADSPTEYPDEIFGNVNKIRTRAGIPTVQESWDYYSIAPGFYNSKENMREIIRTERTIELMFEGQRFWDLRRWKTAHEELNDPHRGWVVIGSDAAEFYNNYMGPVVIWDQAKFIAPRDYLWPIRSEEVMISGNVQNPGW